jgi:hypothetical protein
VSPSAWRLAPGLMPVTASKIKAIRQWRKYWA